MHAFQPAQQRNAARPIARSTPSRRLIIASASGNRTAHLRELLQQPGILLVSWSRKSLLGSPLAPQTHPKA
jgi:hypothetical protein